VADAAFLRAQSPALITMQAAANPGELRQGPDGRAYYLKAGATPSVGASVGDRARYVDADQVTVTKTTGIQILDGGRVYWDRTNRKAHYKQINGQDFYAGVAVGDAASGDTSMVVKLNVQQSRRYLMERDPFTPVPIGTPAESVLLRSRGGAWLMTLDATNEAQKIDALAVTSENVSTAANAIFEAAFNVLADDSGTAATYSLGFASATHATAFTSIANYLGIQVKAHDGKIYAASKATGGVTVAVTDTTKTYSVGTRVEVWIDMRNPAACGIYINGVQVLTATVFDVSFSSTAWLALVHLVKTASTDTMQVQTDWAWIRTAEQ
jgi:predicted RecA/RadA family phage recombinase